MTTTIDMNGRLILDQASGRRDDDTARAGGRVDPA